MSTMTLTRPTRPPEQRPPRPRSPRLQSPSLPSSGLESPGLRSHCVRLAAGPAAVPAARAQVRAAVRAWAVPADQADLALLTSELVTNAVGHAAGPVVTLVISCSRGQVRVDVHDTSGVLPEVADVPAGVGGRSMPGDGEP
jgi:hypothetical protein